MALGQEQKDRMKNVHPRYRLYCLARGYKSIEEAIAKHNGSGHDYTCWISQQWRKWDAETKHKGWVHTAADHAAFDAWLERQVTLSESKLETEVDEGE